MENSINSQGATTAPDWAKVILCKLDEIKSFSKSVLTVAETASYMGCSTMNVRRHMYAGDIAYSNPTGGRVYIQKADIDRFLMSNRIASTNDIEDKASQF